VRSRQADRPAAPPALRRRRRPVSQQADRRRGRDRRRTAEHDPRPHPSPPQLPNTSVRRTGAISCVSLLALAAAGCGGTPHHRAKAPNQPANQTANQAKLAPLQATPIHKKKTDPVLARLGLAPLHTSSPLPGYLMIADRDNNRIIIVSPKKRIVWRFPTAHALR